MEGRDWELQFNYKVGQLKRASFSSECTRTQDLIHEWHKVNPTCLNLATTVYLRGNLWKRKDNFMFSGPRMSFRINFAIILDIQI